MKLPKLKKSTKRLLQQALVDLVVGLIIAIVTKLIN